jgi:hypothetical protein
VQGEIVSALTKKPVLKPRQLKTLEIYWKAATSGEPALAVDAVGTRLADSMGDGFADEIPLLAMFDISKGSTGEVRHRLTSDGIVAVKAALGLSSRGKAAVSTVDEDYDPAEVVALGMSQGAASQIMRVAESKGMGIDEAIKLMTAMMGAG